MRILLTNDDGISAPGIIALHDALMDPEGRYGGPVAGPKTQIVVIAPADPQSATGHGVTFHRPLMVREVAVTPRFTGLSVDGRPADCVKLAVASLWPARFGEGSRPDLAISGLNAGANCGINVIYSGTVAAALEAAFLGVPSIAASLHIGRSRPRFDVAAARARRAIEVILQGGVPKRHECLSVNIPITESGGPMPPIRVGTMNLHGLVDKYERRVSPDGREYYWPAGHGLDFRGVDPGSDVDLLMRRCVTITPLTHDLCDHGGLERWRRRLETPAAGAAPEAPRPEVLPVDQSE